MGAAGLPVGLSHNADEVGEFRFGFPCEFGCGLGRVAEEFFYFRWAVIKRVYGHQFFRSLYLGY